MNYSAKSTNAVSVEIEQEKVNMQKNLDERQLNRSRCIVAPLFQK